jgi:hypothetical protein
LPTYDGGSPVLGFYLWMRYDDDQFDPDYTLVKDDEEDVTSLTYTSSSTHTEDKIKPGHYLFAIEARNWVGTGAKSVPLNLTIDYLSSPDLTIVNPEGTIAIEGAVTVTVSINAKNELGEAKTEYADDAYFLHVENVCFVTSNYRCDPDR